MGALLAVVFLVVPIVELAVIIQVGQVVGVGWTILALVTVSIVGAVLVRREGVRSWRRFRKALEEGRLPAAEVVDGALVLLGGALMVTPGFVTDAVGLMLVAPPSRDLVNRAIRRRARAGLDLPRRPRPDIVDVEPVAEVVRVERDDQA